ncbi:hypothetical protein SV7mr_51590 [Stieleria bergensis]|uniref:Uncharacterized protein n=1 Tax=Stieleria bergensis TaxID=2528025 RepID=A0A517T2K3_9BACT|nr:hypothetical protein SV7mr_51590 [Planctomycetes bacterium SV_7m_r]
MKDQSVTDKRLTRLLYIVPVAMTVALALMGRNGWCPQGDPLPWSLDIWSPHNSQHLLDAYSLSHIQHGIGLFLLLGLISKGRLSFGWKAVIVAAIEAGWEVLENTPLIINRYREATISLDYFGDSISNSLSDYLMCLLGLFVADKLGWKWSLTLFVTLETISLIWIRDSLLLNIIMLVYPNDVIRQWQSP